MNVASLSLCKELYELSGWDSLEYHPNAVGTPITCPAYDLGYLLRKLPRGCYIAQTRKGWTASSGNAREIFGKQSPITLNADTPEDAACKLVIELFKQGILKKGNPNGL